MSVNDLPKKGEQRRFGNTWPEPPKYGAAAQAFEEKNQARILAQRAEFEAENRRIHEERRAEERAQRAEEQRQAEELRLAVEEWERNAPAREHAAREALTLTLELDELDTRSGQIVRRLREIDDFCRHPKEDL